MYKRLIEDNIKEHLFKGKVVIIYGPRQVGKTTLSKKILKDFENDTRREVKTLILECDVPSQRDILKSPEPEKLKKSFGDVNLVLIDEAQLVENIGVVLKTFVDRYPEVQIIATGSSSFDLANKTKEPLTGRAFEYFLYPLSVQEVACDNLILYKGKEEFYFRFGFYPGIVDVGEVEALERLQIMQENYLYKDILRFENIKKPEALDKLIKLLAFSIGSPQNINNISREIGVSTKTVERYINLLEKMFVIKRLYGYNRNVDNEIKKGFKIYFIDIGMRNSIIKNHNDMSHRDDVGALFENMFVIERMKYESINREYSNKYFWRTYNDIEVDYVEEKDGMLFAYECKYKERASRSAKIFEENYPNAKVNIVTRDNYLDFILK